MPELRRGDVAAAARRGVRAQALDRDGTLVDDFVVHRDRARAARPQRALPRRDLVAGPGAADRRPRSSRTRARGRPARPGLEAADQVARSAGSRRPRGPRSRPPRRRRRSRVEADRAGSMPPVSAQLCRGGTDEREADPQAPDRLVVVGDPGLDRPRSRRPRPAPRAAAARRRRRPAASGPRPPPRASSVALDPLGLGARRPPRRPVAAGCRTTRPRSSAEPPAPPAARRAPPRPRRPARRPTR